MLIFIATETLTLILDLIKIVKIWISSVICAVKQNSELFMLLKEENVLLCVKTPSPLEDLGFGCLKATRSKTEEEEDYE